MTSSTRGPAVGVRDLIDRRGRDALWALPALFAIAYLVVLLVNYSAVITSINMYGDAVIAPVLGKLAGQAPPGSQILLGHHPYYEEWLFLRATAGLPFYRQLWEVAPMLWSFLGFGCLAWSARRALGRFAALLTLCALICLAGLARFSFFTFDWHGLTVLHTILIGAALVWLAPRTAEIGWGQLTGVAVVLGLISALPTASDQLFLLWALVPMCLIAALMAYRGTGRARWTPLAFALITVLVAVGAGAEIAHLMVASGVRASFFTYKFAGSVAGVVKHMELLLGDFMSLGGGYFFLLTPNLLGALVLANGVLLVVALVAGAAQARRWLTAAIPVRSGQRQPAGPAQVYIGFWLASLTVQCAAFVATSAPGVVTTNSRYVLAGYIAIMALMPLLALRGPRWRLAVTAGVCLFALSVIIQLARRPFEPFYTYPTPAVAQKVLAFARAHDVQRGYAGYSDGPDLTWLTHFKLRIYPVNGGCGPEGLCPFPIAQINTWYLPRARIRSMLIADSSQIPINVNRIDRRLGRPLAEAHIGNLTVAVYPYDIAAGL